MYSKEIKVENGVFSITSPTELNPEINIDEFKNDLIKIYFEPYQPMSDFEITEAVKPHETILLNEIQNITNAFPHIYKNFHFDNIFYYYSYDVIQSFPKSINRGMSLSVGVSIK